MKMTNRLEVVYSGYENTTEEKYVAIDCDAISSREVMLNNIVLKATKNRPIKIGNSTYDIGSCLTSGLQPDYWLTLRCGEGLICIGVSEKIITCLLEPLLSGVKFSELEKNIQLAAIEVACDSWFTVFESNVKDQISVLNISKCEPEVRDNTFYVIYSLSQNGVEKESLHMRCYEDLAFHVGSSIQQILDSRSSKDSIDKVTLLVTATLGSTELLHCDIAKLAPGDVVLIRNRVSDDSEHVGIRVGSTNHMMGKFDRNGISITSQIEEVGMDKQIESENIADASGLLSVQLNFDVGSIEMPVSEFVELTEGCVLKMNRDIDSPIKIMCGPRLVGHGELVEIDGKMLGVRIVRLLGSN